MSSRLRRTRLPMRAERLTTAQSPQRARMLIREVRRAQSPEHRGRGMRHHCLGANLPCSCHDPVGLGQFRPLHHAVQAMRHPVESSVRHECPQLGNAHSDRVAVLAREDSVGQLRHQKVTLTLSTDRHERMLAITTNRCALLPTGVSTLGPAKRCVLTQNINFLWS